MLKKIILVFIVMLISACTNVVFYPNKIRYTTPSELHSNEDQVIPSSHGQKLFKLAGKPKFYK